MLVRNTIEEFVIEAVQQQLDPQDKGNELYINELIVTTLNLLPPLYACTERGWIQQRTRIQSTMLEQVSTAVQLAKAQLKNNSPKFPIPLTLHEIRRSEHCLFHLRRLLEQPDLTWKDLPELLEKKISASRTRNTFDPMALQEPKIINPRYEEDIEFYSYYITASYSFVNVLESTVIAETHKRIKQMGKSMTPGIKMDDIACYVLNRLPPQYVSHILKFREKNEQPSEELSKEVHQGVIDSLMRLNSSPARAKSPLPLARFELDFRQVMPKVEEILRPAKPLSVGNIVDQIEVALEDPDRVKEKLSLLLIQVCEAYGLNLETAGLNVRLNKDGSIGFYSSQDKTTWTIAEQPHLAAYICLINFPRLSGLILTSPVLSSPLRFSRKELFQELANSQEIT
jgi:hypothetical protein